LPSPAQGEIVVSRGTKTNGWKVGGTAITVDQSQNRTCDDKGEGYPQVHLDTVDVKVEMSASSNDQSNSETAADEYCCNTPKKEDPDSKYYVEDALGWYLPVTDSLYDNTYIPIIPRLPPPSNNSTTSADFNKL
jgi:hypothetical protein